MRRRGLLLIPLLVILFTLLLGVGMGLGRGSQSPLAIVQNHGYRAGKAYYTVLDIDRRVMLERELSVPGVVGENWHLQPPLVLQRETPGDAVHWTLSAVDIRRNTFQPVMHLTTPTNIGFRIDDTVVRERADGPTHVTAYLQYAGEIWTSTSANPDATLLATVNRHLAFPLLWSPDENHLAVKDSQQAGLTVVNAADGSTRTFDAPPGSWAVWSADSRYLLILPFDDPFSDAERAGSPMIIEVQTGAVTTLGNAAYATWCGDQLFTVDDETQSASMVSLYDPASGQSRAIFNLDRVPDFDVSPLNDRCELLLLSSRTGDEQQLLNTVTGVSIPLGYNIAPLEWSGETFTYQTMTYDRVELWQLRIGADTAPVMLGSLPGAFPFVTWFDDWQRGLFVNNRMLTLADLRDSSSVPLIDTENWAYSLLKD